MIVTSLVKTGIGKKICDDAIFNGRDIINSDSVVVNDEDISWIAVADGVGGNAGGNEASQYVLEYIKNQYMLKNDETIICSLLNDANKHLIEYSEGVKGKEVMATTFSGLFFSEDTITISHSGNTRVYALQGSYLKQLTTDHTTYQWLRMQGEYEAANKCNKSEIMSCFGGGDEKLLSMLSIEMLKIEEAPNFIIITTDGIHDYVDIDTLENIITENISVEERIEKIWNTAVDRGSCDDCSVVVLER